jgi:hemerythrin
MTPQWNPDLSMQNEVIDTHHKELFKLVSMLDSALADGSDEGIQHILEFLQDYVLDHFDEEEELMQETGYPGLRHHHTDHIYFRAIVADLEADFKNGTFRTHLIFRIRQFIDKLVQHILTIDGQLAVHLKGLNTDKGGNVEGNSVEEGSL